MSYHPVSETKKEGAVILAEDTPISFMGDILIAARKACGWSQRRLSAESGVYQAVIARWEVERYRSTGFERTLQMARILGLDIRITVSQSTEPEENGRRAE